MNEKSEYGTASQLDKMTEHSSAADRNEIEDATRLVTTEHVRNKNSISESLAETSCLLNEPIDSVTSKSITALDLETVDFY